MTKQTKSFVVTDLRRFIKKSHLKAVEDFNQDLVSFSEETGENPVTLYEDPFVSFTLKDVHVDSLGELHFEYDGAGESHACVELDYETNQYYEIEIDGIMDWIKFWRSCLRRAKRYWSMESERLDAIQEGEMTDEEDEEE